MAFSRNHAVAADGTFSATGAAEWDKAHALSDAVSGGIPFFSSTTTEGTSALLAANAVVLGGGAGVAPFTDAGLTYDPSTDIFEGNGVIRSTKNGAHAVGVLVSGQVFVGIGRNSSVGGMSLFGGENATPSDSTPTGLLATNILKLSSSAVFGWASSNVTQNIDTAISRASANSLLFSASPNATISLATSRTEINKAVTAFTDGVAKATFTVTIPNAAHCATLEVEVTGICGAGGAIGAGECSATNSYKFNISRTAGVNAVVGASAAYGAATSAVAGATTLTATAAASAVAGAVGASNTFTVDVTITKGGGASDNHTCLMYGKLMNANASGITIA